MKWKDNAIVYLTRKLWQFSEGNRRGFIIYNILFVFSNALDLAEPLIIAKILEVIQTEGVTSDNLPKFLLYLSLIIFRDLAFWLFHGPARVLEQKNAFVARTNYRKYLLNGTLHLSPEWHTNHHSGDTIDKIDKASGALFGFGEDSFEVYGTILRFIGAYIALAYFNLNSIYSAILLTILAFWLVSRFDKKLIPQYKELYKAENKVAEKIYDTISNITTVIILRVEKLVANNIYQKIIAPFKLFQKNITINETKWFLTSTCSALMTFSVIATYLYTQISHGQVVALGLVYVLYSYAGSISSVFFRFAWLYGSLLHKKAAMSNAEEISREFQKALRTKEIDLTQGWKELRIENLSFSYDPTNSAKINLNNINLKIKRGERVAVIGESGSGKTTLLKVIRELYQPQKLKLTLDGQLLKHGFKNISESISLIPQEPEIFATTIKENITIGVNYSMKEIKKFTDLACFTEVALRLPKQFNSSVVEKGVNLSGGQKQRLALTRGLLASVDKEIILLDEPTSSVDFANELHIYQNIFKTFKKQTIISSIHRLNLLPLFDTIYLFEEGKIIAHGTLQELLKNSSAFQAIWTRYNETKNLAE